MLKMVASAQFKNSKLATVLSELGTISFTVFMYTIFQLKWALALFVLQFLQGYLTRY